MLKGKEYKESHSQIRKNILNNKQTIREGELGMQHGLMIAELIQKVENIIERKKYNRIKMHASKMYFKLGGKMR